MEQLAPLGDAAGLLTPARIRSSPDVFPQQAERLSDAALAALKIWQRAGETGLF